MSFGADYSLLSAQYSLIHSISYISKSIYGHAFSNKKYYIKTNRWCMAMFCWTHFPISIVFAKWFFIKIRSELVDIVLDFYLVFLSLSGDNATDIAICSTATVYVLDMSFSANRLICYCVFGIFCRVIISRRDSYHCKSTSYKLFRINCCAYI